MEEGDEPNVGFSTKLKYQSCETDSHHMGNGFPLSLYRGHHKLKQIKYPCPLHFQLYNCKKNTCFLSHIVYIAPSHTLLADVHNRFVEYAINDPIWLSSAMGFTKSLTGAREITEIQFQAACG